MQYSVNLTLTDDTIRRVNGLLQGTVPHRIPEGLSIWSCTARFPDGSQCRIQVLSRGPAYSPLLAPEWFNSLGEPDTETLWPADLKAIEGTYQWAINEDQEYYLTVEQEK